MTKERAKELLPIIQAHAQGKIIEWRYHSCGNNPWRDTADPLFSELSMEFRIKPEPQWRPWRPEEVPVGGIMRPKTGSFFRWLIVAVNGNGIFTASSSSVSSNDFKYIFHSFEHSIDNGATWKPCGIQSTL